MIDRFYAAKTAASAVARTQSFRGCRDTLKVPKSPRENAPKDRPLFETELCKTLGTARINA